MGVVRSLYFNYMAIAMIGFGDIAPETVNMLQTLIVSLYLLVGMIFLAVTHVAFSYWIQRIFFVVIKEKIYQRHLRNAAKRRLSTSYSFKTDNHSIN
uniref:Potassium channel domain-containing protein n=1 Tax=Panagrolaimus sp. JU765 TaxID=591449 RepID=A0AC34R0A6_9BILA